MVVKIIGIQRQDYKLDSGYEFHGNKVHCIDLETKEQGLVGNPVTTFKLPDGHPYFNNMTVGSEYTVFFDQKGKVAYLQPSGK